MTGTRHRQHDKGLYGVCVCGCMHACVSVPVGTLIDISSFCCVPRDGKANCNANELSNEANNSQRVNRLSGD